MPATGKEWLVFLAGLCIVGVLFALVIDERMGKSSPAQAHQTRLDVSPATRSVSVPRTTSSGAAAAPPSTASRPTPTPAVRLLVNASRGDSWIMVRSGSATGKLLFQGTLAKGRSLRAAGKVLWVRVGAGANLDARVNGRSVKLLAGTFTALMTPTGRSPAP